VFSLIINGDIFQPENIVLSVLHLDQGILENWKNIQTLIFAKNVIEITLTIGKVVAYSTLVPLVI